MMDQVQFARLNDAIALAQSGLKSQAYAELKDLVRITNGKDVTVLLWLAFTTSELEEAETAITMAETVEPANPNVTGAKNWLLQEKANQERIKHPTIAQPAPVVARRKIKLTMVFWVWAAVGLLVVGLVILLLVNLFSSSGPTYKFYDTVDQMLTEAAPGDHIMFALALQVSLANAQNPNYDSYILGTSTMYERGIIIDFPRSGNLRPSRGLVTYYARVRERSKDGAFLYLDAEKTDGSSADFLPPPVNLKVKATKVLRTDIYPNLGQSLIKESLFWLVVDIEVRGPADRTGNWATKIESQIKSTGFHLIPKNPQLSRSYPVKYANLKSVTQGDEQVLTGQIVAMTPADWVSLDWTGILENQYIKVPLKL
jgi:hypothetical protein